MFPRSGEVEAIEALVAFVPADEGAIGSADGVGGFAVSVVGALGAVAGAGFPPGIGSGFERDGVVPVAAGVAAGAGFGGAAADGVPESESKRNIEVGFPPVAGALALGVEGLELGVDGVGPVLKIGAGAGFAAGPSPGDVLLETVGDPVLKIGAGVGFESEGDPSPGEVLLEPVSKIGVGAGFDAVVVDGVPAAALSGDAGLLSAAFAASSGDFGSVIAGDS